MSEFLTKEKILAADDLKTIEVNVPEWGGVARVRMMSAEERVEFENASTAGPDGAEKHWWDIYKLVLSMTLVDADGNPLFTVAEAEALGKKSMKACHRVFSASVKLSKLSQQDLEELAKNFDDGQENDSSSD